MENMKKLLLSLSAVLFLLFVVSCDKATNTTNGYFDGIFTVYGHTIMPELEDTSYVVGDLSSYGLKTGDRALMRVKYNIDNVYGPLYAKWSVDKVYEVIEPGKITSGDDIAEGDFQSSILGVAEFLNYGAVWTWNGLQNIYVGYECDGSEPEFRMIAPEIKNDTLQLSLVARMKSGDKQYVKLLSYDLTTAYPLLDTEAQNAIIRYDSINTKINVRYYDYVEEVAVPGVIIGGKLKNPFKK